MMWKQLLTCCLAKPGAWQDEPWEGDVVVKAGPRIFAFLGSAPGDAVSLRCGLAGKQPVSGCSFTRSIYRSWPTSANRDGTACGWAGRFPMMSYWKRSMHPMRLPSASCRRTALATSTTIKATTSKRSPATGTPTSYCGSSATATTKLEG
jgi:hypothetical protein